MLADQNLDRVLALCKDLLHNALHLLPIKSIVATADARHGHFGDFMIALQRQSKVDHFLIESIKECFFKRLIGYPY